MHLCKHDPTHTGSDKSHVDFRYAYSNLVLANPESNMPNKNDFTPVKKLSVSVSVVGKL